MLITTPEEMHSLSPIPPAADSARLLLHPASNLAGQGADGWQFALDAGRLQLRRHHIEALAMIEGHRPVLDPALTPGAVSVQEGAAVISEKLDRLDCLLEQEHEAFLAHQPWHDDGRVQRTILEAAANLAVVVGSAAGQRWLSPPARAADRCIRIPSILRVPSRLAFGEARARCRRQCGPALTS